MNFWNIGQSYLVRTHTYFMVGELLEFSDNEMVFKVACFVADTGRFHNALINGFDSQAQLEPFPDDALLNRNSIVDATTWRHNLPCVQQ